ncbi:phosphomannomutase/phosphoglucomutase [Dinoroseobacter sp. PD6]|uniref:phosphomannomutase/phosphoglucomutase n=1 Tax=Dinoroseobacter sp. PD6 TaxID=3028384 RepID=UPI00237B053F|nr:phosphomannomutase/phosphoglucomutase [Dinoroseobacter sp. PD6]MDD9715259.1 phosphomannomutase/phosphoglucomutase [Dinoroseobacter sp. PD6]
MSKLECFKAYDVRGRIGDTLDTEIAQDVGRAVAEVLGARCVVVGRDIRDSSPALCEALGAGLRAAGADVRDIGLCGTEEVYFATDHLDACAGVMVTASHNPIDYNGFKIVGRGARPLPDAQFRAIERLAATRAFAAPAAQSGTHLEADTRAAYVARVCSFVDPAALGPVHVVANAGNGCAGPTFDAVIAALEAGGAKIEVTRLHHAPDARFPNGIPNPLLPENQPATSTAITRAGADLGIAWDGDFDRCFFFDETGAFIPGEFVVGLLAEAILEQTPGASIVYDPRVVWNTRRIVEAAGGAAVLSKTGHVLVKDTMRRNDAVYGGEMSAHHYFRDFMFCDSGMIPWLLMLERLSKSGRPLSAAVAEMRRRHPSSGEINFRVSDAARVMATLRQHYADSAEHVDTLDGVSMEFADWRFNLRASNTEPLLRLNVETLESAALLDRRVGEIRSMIEATA